MNNFELGLLDKIQEIFSCEFLDKVIPIITKLGDEGLLWIALAVIFLFFKTTRKIGITMGLSLLIGYLVGNLFLKNVIARVRPYNLNTEAVLLIPKLKSFSFPSGHTLSSFEGATSIFLRNKKWGIPALVLAVLIAFSRMYLYVHYPTDVLAGAILGIAISFLAKFIVDKIYLKIENKKAR